MIIVAQLQLYFSILRIFVWCLFFMTFDFPIFVKMLLAKPYTYYTVCLKQTESLGNRFHTLTCARLCVEFTTNSVLFKLSNI